MNNFYHKSDRSYAKPSLQFEFARNRRKPSGQGLSEGVATLCIIIPILLVFILAMVNVYAIITYNTKLNLIATEALKWRREDKFWLGMQRYPTGSEQDLKAKESAKKMALAMAGAAGIDLAMEDVQIEDKTVSGNGQSMEGVECRITSRSFKFPFADVPGFPLLFKPSVAVSLAAVPVAPPVVVAFDTNMNVNNPSGENVCYYVPCYGAIWSSTNKLEATRGPLIGTGGPVPMPDGTIHRYPVFGIMNVGQLLRGQGSATPAYTPNIP